ncbi:hypothetical protein SLA2020_495260 [Shorea laevis]
MSAAPMKIVFGLLTLVTVGMIIGASFQLAFIRKLEDSYELPSLRRLQGNQNDGYLQLPRGIFHWDNDKEARVLRVGYVKPEVISWSPRIIVLHNFLSMEECDYLRSLALPRLQISTVVDTKTGKDTALILNLTYDSNKGTLGWFLETFRRPKVRKEVRL